MAIRSFFRAVGAAAEKNAPTILMLVGAGGSVTAMIMAIRETPKAHELLLKKKQEKKELAEDRGEVPEEITLKEEAGIFFKVYWPALLTEAGAIACFLVANKIHLRRGAALAALYRASEETFRLYQDKVRDRIGEKEEHEVHRAVVKNQIEDAFAQDTHTIFETGHGNQLFIDLWSKRIFRSNLEDIRHAQNSFNKRLLNEGDCSLNDWYDEIGLDDTCAGERLGWCCDSLADQVEIKYEAYLLDDKSAVTSIQFMPQPGYDFRYSTYRR